MVLCIFPVEVYDSKTFSVKILSDHVVVSEECAEVVKVAVSHVLDAEIVDNENFWRQRTGVVVGS